MMLYEIVKTVHILSATILFGTGLGTAWFMWRADRSGDAAAVVATARNVVLADWLFTTPAIVLQPLSGLWLVLLGGYSPTEIWLMWTYGLYLLAGACWLPVVWLQIRMRDLAAEAVSNSAPLSARYRCYARIWFGLGWPAFIAVILIVYLMVAKP
ncbi:MAG TPA: DUF2269 domain-containing protein [Candidatus Angelobacter sp.]|nr:DUF2269 domain-containing protein [Candidatus Angelobacter sp.]